MFTELWTNISPIGHNRSEPAKLKRLRAGKKRREHGATRIGACAYYVVSVLRPATLGLFLQNHRYAKVSRRLRLVQKSTLLFQGLFSLWREFPPRSLRQAPLALLRTPRMPPHQQRVAPSKWLAKNPRLSPRVNRRSADACRVRSLSQLPSDQRRSDIFVRRSPAPFRRNFPQIFRERLDGVVKDYDEHLFANPCESKDKLAQVAPGGTGTSDGSAGETSATNPRSRHRLLTKSSKFFPSFSFKRSA